MTINFSGYRPQILKPQTQVRSPFFGSDTPPRGGAVPGDDDQPVPGSGPVPGAERRSTDERESSIAAGVQIIEQFLGSLPAQRTSQLTPAQLYYVAMGFFEHAEQEISHRRPVPGYDFTGFDSRQDRYRALDAWLEKQRKPR